MGRVREARAVTEFRRSGAVCAGLSLKCRAAEGPEYRAKGPSSSAPGAPYGEVSGGRGRLAGARNIGRPAFRTFRRLYRAEVPRSARSKVVPTGEAQTGLIPAPVATAERCATEDAIGGPRRCQEEQQPIRENEPHNAPIPEGGERAGQVVRLYRRLAQQYPQPPRPDLVSRDAASPLLQCIPDAASVGPLNILSPNGPMVSIDTTREPSIFTI